MNDSGSRRFSDNHNVLVAVLVAIKHCNAAEAATRKTHGDCRGKGPVAIVDQTSRTAGTVGNDEVIEPVSVQIACSDSR